MQSIDYQDLSRQICEALRETFAGLLEANPDQTFYTFAIWTDDSLQFANAAANTEEGLAEAVRKYAADDNEDKRNAPASSNMRWAYGDWKFFPVEDGNLLAEVNTILQDNFNSDEAVFDQQLAPLWQSLLNGFLQLERDGFFGTGTARSKITLLLVGDLDDETVDKWAAELNPPDVAERFINWDYESQDVPQKDQPNNS